MIHIALAGTELKFDENSLHFSMRRNGADWNWEENYVPKFIAGDEETAFLNAGSVSHEIRETGLGEAFFPGTKLSSSTEKSPPSPLPLMYG